MIRTATPTPAAKTAPQRPYISTSSLILSPYTKGPPTVEVTTTHSVGVPLPPVDRTLKHQRTLRPTDFDRPANTPSPVNLEPSSPLPTRDAPPAPASSSPKRSSPDRSAEGRAQTTSSGVQRISRPLRREKTLMPEDFSKAREQDSPNSPDRSSSRTQRESPQTDAADPSSSRPRRGFATISLGPSADDQRRYSRSPTDTRHYTCWQRVGEFEDAHRQLAISADTAQGEVFQIQGVLVFSAFDDRSRGPHNEHPDSVFSVADVCVELRTYSRNSCAYAKETAEAPEYIDISRRADSLIKVAFDANERRWRLGSSGRGHAAPVSCSFSMGIPVHLFRSAKERYFRVTARVNLDVGPRHPLSYNSSGSGGCRSNTVQLACAASDPVDFTVSYLALPRSP